MMKNILFICTLTALLSACSESRLFKKEEQYTPLCTYFNPLDLDMNIETLMPYFVNYSTDWAKMGLRSHPMMVTYKYNNTAWGITATSQYVFLANGRLSEQRRTSFSVGASGFDVIAFEYDGYSNLINIKSVEDGHYKRQHNDNGFTYDSTGKLIRREKSDRANPGTWNYLFEYHENGILKSISPEKDNVLTSEAGVTLYKFQFDSLAHMKRLETPTTTNMFLKDIGEYKKGKSVITFTYTDNLCTQAVEKIPVKFDRGTETLTCTSNFIYNSHGDLITWTYSGGVYQDKGNGWRVDDMMFAITYDYVYDNKGNWTQAKITFPANIDEIPALRTYYKASKNGITSNQDRSSSVKVGEVLILTIEPTIDYWADDAIASCHETETHKDTKKDNGLRYKGTDIYWLSNKVKSVTQESSIGDRSQLKFDQSGNLVYKDDNYANGATTYKYITSTAYNVNGWGDAVVDIKIEDGKRSDICSDASTTELNQEYTFDSKSRIVKHRFTSYMAYVTCTYQYEDEKRIPAVMVRDHPEEGVTTYHYTYTKFDKHKNWIERKISYSTEYDKYDENGDYIGDEYTSPKEYTEKRDIEYW